MGGVALQHAFALVHADIKIERGAVRIDGAQRPPLERNLREARLQSFAFEPERGAVEVVFACELEAECIDRRLAGGAQYDGMMVPLLDAPKVECLRRLLTD